MPFHSPFNFPPFYNNNFRRPSYTNSSNYSQSQYNNITSYQSDINKNSKTLSSKKEDSENNESSESFFEIFGLKLHFDDILIICLLFILYSEKVQDDELFICLILLLLA